MHLQKTSAISAVAGNVETAKARRSVRLLDLSATEVRA